MKMFRSGFWGLAITLGLSGLAPAQQGWQSKPYREWTKDDIIKIASDSPWAQVQQVKVATAEEIPTDFVPAVTIRLRSALPIRQALARLKQIDAKYDKMSDKDRATFDAKVKGLLECPACAANYIVTLGPPISRHQMKNGLGTLIDSNLSLLQKRVYLINDRGERRELIHFVAPKHVEDEATFFFARLDEKRKPLLAPDNKKLYFMFEGKNLRTGFGLD